MSAFVILKNLLGLILTIAFSYQIFYHLIGFVARPIRYRRSSAKHFAILIAARNEEHVISDLLHSLQNQHYPQDHIHVFVIADNCQDQTAEVARSLGATVFERHNTFQVGKGYALDMLISSIYAEGLEEGIDAFLVFDADNVLAPDYLDEMNACYSEGNLAITSFRSSKNMDDNWQTAGYSLGFIHDARFLNNVRNILGQSSAISGTGYLLCRSIMDQFKGWPFKSLTEDTELTFWLVANDYRVAYCDKAVFYDEQPTKFQQSWHQRMRWTKGSFQAFRAYGKVLARRSMEYLDMSSWDLMILNSPIQVLTFVIVAMNLLTILAAALHPDVLVRPYLIETLKQLFGMFAMFASIGAITTVKEWKRIPATRKVKLFGPIGYALHMMIYPLIYMVSLFKKVTWIPMVHQRAKGVESITTDL